MNALPPGAFIVAIFVILLLLPIRIPSEQLKRLAFSIWLSGGIIMSYNGFIRLQEANLDSNTLWLAVGIALLIGVAKGIFVLGKTSARNIERIDAMREPQKPLAVYSKKSWIILAVMVLLAVSLNVFGAPLFWRGVVSFGIGMALIVSSLRYLQKPKALSAV